MRWFIAHLKEILMARNASIRPGALLITDPHAFRYLKSVQRASFLRGRKPAVWLFLSTSHSCLWFLEGRCWLAGCFLVLPASRPVILSLGFNAPIPTTARSGEAGVIREGTTSKYSLINMRTFRPNNFECIIPNAQQHMHNAEKGAGTGDVFLARADGYV